MADYATGLDSVGSTLQIIVVDLLLSGDNALLIAMACRQLGEKQARRAMRLGVGAAIAIRLALTFVISTLLVAPGVKLVGAVVLALIAMHLIVGDPLDEEASEAHAPEKLAGAIAMIVAADLSMGIDNIVAVAAVANGNFLYLLFGLALSIPLLMVGAVLISRLLDAWPMLVIAGGALLGWIAGGLAASDPLIADWLSGQAPALAAALPALVALFVTLQARFARARLLTQGLRT